MRIHSRCVAFLMKCSAEKKGQGQKCGYISGTFMKTSHPHSVVEQLTPPLTSRQGRSNLSEFL